jgi:hypothetical protein
MRQSGGVEAGQKTGRADELRKQLADPTEAQNKGKEGGTCIPATFMRVTVSL